jgi:hypothetical protein
MSFAVALVLVSHETWSEPASGPASTHTQSLRSMARSHHRQHVRGVGAFYLPSTPVYDRSVDIAPSSGDTNYTYKQDVPWDWAHRYPPSYYETPPAPPPAMYEHSPGCASQIVTVPTQDGREQTISIMRC